MIFLKIDLTILPWIKKKILYRKTTKSIPSLFPNKRSQTNLSTKTQKKRISNRWNPLTFPIETTEDKTKKLSILYHQQPNPTNSLTKLDISLNQMCVGDMTTNISKTNGRRPRQTNSYLNQRLCLPVHTIPQ